MGARVLCVRCVPRVWHHRALLHWREPSDRSSVHGEHHSLVGVSVDLVSCHLATWWTRDGSPWPYRDCWHATLCGTQSRQCNHNASILMHRWIVWRIRSRLSRVFRLRRYLAKLLLLAG